MLTQKQKEKGKDMVAYTIWLCHILFTYAVVLYLIFIYAVLPLWKHIKGWGLPIIGIIYFVILIATDRLLRLMNWAITRVNNDD